MLPPVGAPVPTSGRYRVQGMQMRAGLELWAHRDSRFQAPRSSRRLAGGDSPATPGADPHQRSCSIARACAREQPRGARLRRAAGRAPSGRPERGCGGVGRRRLRGCARRRSLGTPIARACAGGASWARPAPRAVLIYLLLSDSAGLPLPCLRMHRLRRKTPGVRPDELSDVANDLADLVPRPLVALAQCVQNDRRELRPGGSSTSGAGELVNDAREQPPEAVDGRDADAFVGGVRRLDLWAERNHV
jgi:hypothetical protein